MRNNSILQQLNNKRVGVIIGIDPDVDKNGVAMIDKAENAISLHSLRFPELMEYLYTFRKQTAETQNIRVIVEAGWLNHAHWHLTPYDTKQSAAVKGNSTGRNHEVGRKIIEMCEHWEISVIPARPLIKRWKGKDKKITQEELEKIVGRKLGRTNQETRDALLLAWVHGGELSKRRK